MAGENSKRRRRAAGPGRGRAALRLALLLAAGLAGDFAAPPARADECTGNCGTLGPNGVVTAPPIAGITTYQFISTAGGVPKGGELIGTDGNPIPGTTNGSTFTTSPFTVNPGAKLQFSFNFVTSDGAGFPDYAWAQLRTSDGEVVATLVTAETKPTGDIIPGPTPPFPPISGSLDPASVPIIPGAPVWAPLGASSGTCYAAGCGYTGWVNETYNIPAAGTYMLVFGVSNVGDTAFNSGFAFAGSTIDGLPITNNIDTSQPFYLASSLGVTLNPVFAGGTLRMNQPGAAYGQNFALDGSLTNTIDEFGNASLFSGVFSDATTGTPGNIVIADSLGGGSAIFTGANTYSGTTTIEAAATLIIGAGGSIDNASTLTNSGRLQVDAGGAVTVATIFNNATGSIGNAGAITANLNNAGLVVNGAAPPTVGEAAALAVADGAWTGDVLSNTGEIDNAGTWTAANFTNNAGGTVTSTGALTATTALVSAGAFNAEGTLSTPLIDNSGVFTVTGALGGEITAITNSGALTVLEGATLTAGAIANTATGSIVNFGAITDALDNAGLVVNNGTYTADVNNLATGVIANNGAWIGDLLSNTGVVENVGTWGSANFTNNAGGTVTSAGVLTETTALNNAGVFNAPGSITTPLINNSGAFTVTGALDGVIDHINNFGFLGVNEGAALTAGGVTNAAGAVIQNFGAITDVLDNSGLVVNNGTYTADVNNFAGGAIVNNGAWIGDLLTNSGSVSNAGTWSAAAFNNDAGGSVSTTGDLTAKTAINNAGFFSAAGSITTPLINNSGVFSVTNGPGGVGGVIGVFNNAGNLTMVNGATNDTFTVTSFNGQGGRLSVDVYPTADLSSQRSDLLKTATLSGVTALFIHPIGIAGLISAPIPVIEAGSVAPGTTVAIANPPGLINYTLVKDGGAYNLISTINTSAISSTPSGIDAVVTALNTGFFQNASAFISEPSDPGRNQWNGGPWIRIAQGQNDIRSETAAQNPLGVATSPAQVRASFNGFQTGVDLGVANVFGSGWNTHFGVTAGEVYIRTNDLLATSIQSQTQVPFLGIYGAVTGHNFFADFEIREDFYNLNLTNPVALLNNTTLNGTALAINASLGYRINLPSSWFIEPSAAFIYSDLRMNSLRMNLDPSGSAYGTLVFSPFRSAFGRAGVRVGTTYVFDGVGLALQPFATGSLWREFEGDTLTTFELPATLVPITVTRVGAFGQVGLGLAGQVLNTGLTGYLRGDYRTGANISGYAVVAGLRYQF